MRIKQTILAIALAGSLNSFMPMSLVFATSCGGVSTSVIDCSQQAAVCPPNTTGPGTDGLCSDKSIPTYKTVTESGIWGLLITVINIMSAGIGVAAVGGIIYGSIKYTSSEGNAESTKKARTIIANVLIGLLMYAVMYAFLNYMIPGGMFNAVK
ncbi:MAG: hypothetical protein WCH58_04500 [Candidatus Saccharibacteria bacterium]